MSTLQTLLAERNQACQDLEDLGSAVAFGAAMATLDKAIAHIRWLEEWQRVCTGTGLGRDDNRTESQEAARTTMMIFSSTNGGCSCHSEAADISREVRAAK